MKDVKLGSLFKTSKAKEGNLFLGQPCKMKF